MFLGDIWVTTTDNKFNPFTEFDQWYDYDINHGYNTCGYVYRVLGINEPSDLPDDIVDTALDNAINDICRLDLTGVPGVHYKKVTPDDISDVLKNANDKNSSEN